MRQACWNFLSRLHIKKTIIGYCGLTSKPAETTKAAISIVHTLARARQSTELLALKHTFDSRATHKLWLHAALCATEPSTKFEPISCSSCRRGWNCWDWERSGKRWTCTDSHIIRRLAAAVRFADVFLVTRNATRGLFKGIGESQILSKYRVVGAFSLHRPLPLPHNSSPKCAGKALARRDLKCVIRAPCEC